MLVVIFLCFISRAAGWGEGDDMILIDDEEEPSINGTGAEDYFNHAWGMQRNQSPYNGTINA